jgi:hypothetical protein
LKWTRIYRGTPRRDVTNEKLDVDLYSPEMNATQNTTSKPRRYSTKQRTIDITPQEPLLHELLKECLPSPKFERKKPATPQQTYRPIFENDNREEAKIIEDNMNLPARFPKHK